MILNYLPRAISSSILDATKYLPVITLTGPRQSGKSTLLRHLFPELPYFSMEDPDIRLSVKDDPRGFLTHHRAGVIIDEIQNTPELMSYIQGIVDRDPSSRFYLTGSSQFALMDSVTQSLAGRTAIYELLPLSMQELGDKARTLSTDTLLYNGFYPAIWSGKITPKFLYPNYTKTYIERDVRNILAVKDLDLFQRFIRLCAARIGSIFVATELSNELGIAVNTVNSWLSILQASYIIYLLPPFHTNTRKRLTKSPKIYFTDCGLAAYLLDITSPDIMNRDKIRGHLFENMVIMEIIKARYNNNVTGGVYFYRDSNGNEVDLMVKSGTKYHCYEIKSSATFHPDYIKGLNHFNKAFPDLTDRKFVIYAGDDLSAPNGISIINYLNI